MLLAKPSTSREACSEHSSGGGYPGRLPMLLRESSLGPLDGKQPHREPMMWCSPWSHDLRSAVSEFHRSTLPYSSFCHPHVHPEGPSACSTWNLPTCQSSRPHWSACPSSQLPSASAWNAGAYISWTLALHCVSPSPGAGPLKLPETSTACNSTLKRNTEETWLATHSLRSMTLKKQTSEDKFVRVSHIL